MEQNTDGILTDRCRHAVEHLIAAHLILNQRVSLTIRLQTDAFAQLIHIVDMSHPLCINHFQKDHALHLAYLFRACKLCLACLIKLRCRLFEHMFQLIFLHMLLVFRQLNRL